MESAGLPAMQGVLDNPWIALALALVLTVIALLESGWSAWSPYFVCYAALALLIPVCAGNLPFGALDSLAGKWGGMAGFLATMAGWEALVMGWGYETVLLGRIGKSGRPFFSPTAALDAILAKAQARFGWGRPISLSLFGFFALIWAPVGEELFYWGYLHRVFSSEFGLLPSLALISAFFGLRHSGHFLFLRPSIPWAAAAAAGLSAAMSAALNTLLFEYTQSLYPLIAIHLACNLLILTLPGKPA